MFRVVAATAVAITAQLRAPAAFAQSECGGAPTFSSPNRQFNSFVSGWDVQVGAQRECNGGVKVDLFAHRYNGWEHTSSGSGGGGGSAASLPSPAPNSILSIPIFCRRDDYMFLPPNALAGIPCVTISEDQAVDPRALALELELSIPPPDLRIGMNPAKGMVNVPTWFWVDGYDGGLLSGSETVVQQHKICHLVANRGDDGLPVLGDDGRPETHQDCHTETTTFDVGVRLYPSLFDWDFGDNQRLPVPCAGIGDCPQGMGLPFVDSGPASSVQHPYAWSSLAASSGVAAYRVGLDIVFGADFRVSINGQDQGGWRSLPTRRLSWAATHQVQEAQAVLTAPGLPAN